jgi:hydroxymethylglutaryl-CoA lyase
MRSQVVIREVGPREALQAHAETLPTERKVELVQGLIDAGSKAINAASFVSPKAMPHMSDAEGVLRGIGPQEGIRVSGLAPNERAMGRAAAMAAEGLLDHVFMVHTPSVSVLQANGFPPSLEQNIELVKRNGDLAHEAGMTIGIFVSAAFGCSMEGRIPQDVTLRTVDDILAVGVADELIISDSTGQADPAQVSSLLAALAPVVGSLPVSVHLHDSRGAGIANAVAALTSPIENLTIDCSFGGLGGDIPFIPEAAGNIATEDLVAMLDGMGVVTGIDARAVAEVARRYRAWTGLPLRSRVSEVPPVPWKQSPVLV